MLSEGDYVQTRRRIPPHVHRGVRGTVLSLDGDTVTVELPQGGRFKAHTENLTRLLRKEQTHSQR